MTTGSISSMPRAARCVMLSLTNSVVTITAVGMPRVSRLIPSRIQHDVQDPQSPIAVMTTSLAAAISAIISGVAEYEKPSFR